jgi:hypothetical protein
VVEENYGAPQVNFAQATVIHTVDAFDGPAAVTVLNFGNALLSVLSPAFSAPSEFQQVAGSNPLADCSASLTLLALVLRVICSLQSSYPSQS